MSRRFHLVTATTIFFLASVSACREVTDDRQCIDASLVQDCRNPQKKCDEWLNSPADGMVISKTRAASKMCATLNNRCSECNLKPDPQNK